MSAFFDNLEARLADQVDDEPTVGLDWILRRLGRRQGKHAYGPGRAVKYLELLIAEFGFPPPYPQLVTGKRGQADRLESEVTLTSQWAKAPVAVWLEDYLPPANADAVDARAQAAAADEMDRAAAGLSLVGGREA